MPKHLLKRRHQRHHNLSQCWQDYSSDLLTREAAARMVSDEDIRQTSSETSSPTNECQNNFVKRLKRRNSSMKLSELASSHPFNENEIIKLSPKRFITHETDCQLGTQPISPSPWGQFVDMLHPSSPADDLSTTQTHDLSLREKSFVPCCPSPRSWPRQDSRHFHPYNISSRPQFKRFSVSSRNSAAKDLEGFLLRVPGESSRGLLQEAEDAFLGLSL